MPLIFSEAIHIKNMVMQQHIHICAKTGELLLSHAIIVRVKNMLSFHRTFHSQYQIDRLRFTRYRTINVHKIPAGIISTVIAFLGDS